MFNHVRGKDFDWALTNFATIEDQCAIFERGHMAHSDRTLGLRPVNPTGASGLPEAGTLLSLTALFFGNAYK
jgi:hypothetical protein